MTLAACAASVFTFATAQAPAFLSQLSDTMLLSQTGHCYFSLSTVPSSIRAGNTKGGSITVPLKSCLTGLESAV